jgi:hypothetical protein
MRADISSSIVCLSTLRHTVQLWCCKLPRKQWFARGSFLHVICVPGYVTACTGAHYRCDWPTPSLQSVPMPMSTAAGFIINKPVPATQAAPQSPQGTVLLGPNPYLARHVLGLCANKETRARGGLHTTQAQPSDCQWHLPPARPPLPDRPGVRSSRCHTVVYRWQQPGQSPQCSSANRSGCAGCQGARVAVQGARVRSGPGGQHIGHVCTCSCCPQNPRALGSGKTGSKA